MSVATTSPPRVSIVDPSHRRALHDRSAADGMDAMLMQRAYNKGCPAKRMPDELSLSAGTRSGPRIAAAAVAWRLANQNKPIPRGESVLAAA